MSIDQGFMDLGGGVLFDELGHQYQIPGGRRPRSVTQLLADSGAADYTFVSDLALERGSNVHQAIHLAVTGILDWASVDPSHVPYVQAALQCLADLRMDTLEVEGAVWSEELETAGRFDYLGRSRRLVTLLEWKSLTSGRPMKAARLQTAGYKRLKFDTDGTVIHERYAVALFPDGKYKLEHHSSPLDVEVFVATAIREKLLAAWRRENS